MIPVQELPIARHLVEGLARLQRAHAELREARAALAALEGVDDIRSIVCQLQDQVEAAQVTIRASSLSRRDLAMSDRHRCCTLCVAPESHGERRRP